MKKILENVDVAKASRKDQISAKFLKEGVRITAICLANITSFLIKLNTFPSQCRITKIKSLFKKEIKTEAKTYKSISLLHLISKVIEKYIYNQMQNYLQRNELSHSYQTSFGANHFTDPRLSMLTDMTLNSAENGKYTGIIFINLEKTFDTLDHKILLEKMKCMGFSVKQ